MTSVVSSDLPTRSATVTLGRDADGQTLLFDTNSRALLELNHTAAEIWLRLDGRPLDVLAEQLASAYAVAKEVVHADVVAAVEFFAANDLLADCPPDPDVAEATEPPRESRWANRWMTLVNDRSTVLPAGPYQVGPVAVDVLTNDAALAKELARILRSLAVGAEAAVARRLVAIERRNGWVVSVDGLAPRRVETRADALTHALWFVNQIATAPRPEWLMLHAAAVEIDGQIIVLPGVSNAGKSTLVTGLVAAGAKYLTDEAAVINRDDLVLHPFPKAIALDPGSFQLFPDFEPPVADAFVAHRSRKWHVDPATIGSIGQPGSIAAVIAPRYERDAPVAVVELAFRDAVETLLGSTFTGTAVDFGSVVALSDQVPVYSMTAGQLDEAVAAVFAIAADTASGTNH